MQLVAHNNSPYNVSVSQVKIKSSQKTFEAVHQSVQPFSEAAMVVKGLSSAVNGDVEYDTINDYGGTDHHKAAVK